MLDITTIPVERLALLDTATLYHGPHGGGTGGADCEHCARELLHEVVTGKHRDATPQGLSEWINILPALNDGPWRDDAHRTEVIRPYLKRLLTLDPAQDEVRLWPFLDYVYRSLTPDLLDALGLPDKAAKLRATDPVIDQKSALALARALAPSARADQWEKITRDVLDRICAPIVDRARGEAA